jgi:hypothetical protein
MEQYGRSRAVVKLNLENQKKMDLLKEQWNNMKRLIDKEKSKGKGILGTKLTDEELAARDETLRLLETLIRDMEALFHNEKKSRSGDNRLASKAKAELDAERQGLKEPSFSWLTSRHEL